MKTSVLGQIFFVCHRWENGMEATIWLEKCTLEHVLNIGFVNEAQGPIGLDASVVRQKVLRMSGGESRLGFGHRRYCER